MYSSQIQGLTDLIVADLKSRGHEKPEVVVKEALEKYWKNKTAFTWTTSDVVQAGLDLGVPVSEEDAVEILAMVLKEFDASIGVNWNVIQLAITEFFEKE